MDLPESGTVLSRIDYNPPIKATPKDWKESIAVTGFDTEADTEGKMFMACTSDGDVWTPEQLPDILFSRKNRNKHFVTWNLKYETGALLQRYPLESIEELRKENKVIIDNITIRVIGNKYLSFRKSNHTVTFWDAMGFYSMGLGKAAQKYLGDDKLEQDVTLYKPEYIKEHWNEIAEYCIQDAHLTKRLAELMIARFESYGVYPRKLYSTAYVSWEHFRRKCPYIHVKRFWDNHSKVLELATRSYNGGKFEVTRKGPGYYYSYDIVSAYPYEISNLLDIRKARVCNEKKWRPRAEYGFLDVTVTIPANLPSPAIVKRNNVCVFPSGTFRRVLTNMEVRWILKHGGDIDIHDAVYLLVDKHTYPYRKEVSRLVREKQQLGLRNDIAGRQTVKILLNSLYGKFVQLIERDGRYRAGSAWNPVYASIITANTRIRMSEWQRKFPSVIAVHTDSVISTEPLRVKKNPVLGDFAAEKEGEGIVLGSGVYQIGDTVKLRGFEKKTNLREIIRGPEKTIELWAHRPYGWREVAFRGMDTENINLFTDIPKTLSLTFDRKRLWLDDYKNFGELLERNVESMPIPAELFSI